MDESDVRTARGDLAEELRSLRAENAALRRRNAAFEAIVEAIDDPVFVKDERGRYAMINAAAARLVGKSAGEILGKGDSDLFPAETAGRFMDDDRRIAAEGEARTFDEAAILAGVTRTYRITKGPYRDGRGRVAGVFGVLHDITERDRAEAEVSRQGEILRTIFDHIPVMICLLGPDARLRMVNREWERVLGWSVEDSLAGDILAELYPDPDERRRVLDYVFRPDGGWAEFRTRAKDGRMIDTAWANVLLSDGTSVGLGLDFTERKRAEAALRSSERQFRAVFEGALDAMVLADDEGRYVDANPAACAHYGLPREELVGKSAADFSEPGFDAAAAWSEFRRSGSSRGLFRLVRPDGSVRETEYAAVNDVLPGRHLSVMRDATERVRAHEAVRASERRILTILESITDGFFTLDGDWRFSYVNPQAEAMLGRSRESLVGRDIWEEFPEAVGTLFELESRRAKAERVRVAAEDYYPPLGRWFSVHAYPSPDGLSVYFTDVTERRRSEEALKQSERRFRRVLENSRDVIYQLSLTSLTYDYISPSSRDVLGIAPEELTSGGLAQAVSTIHPEDLERLRGHLVRLKARTPGHEFDSVLEYRMQVPGKGWRWMSDSGTIIRGEDGLPVAVVGTVRDVTDKKGAEERLRELSRGLIEVQEEERRRLARELHDEVGQALTAIGLGLRAAARSRGDGGRRPIEECLDIVDGAIRQVRNLSLDLRPSMLDDLGLVSALRWLVDRQARLAGHRARFDADAGEDDGRLDQAVATAAFRVAQEALTNVARHARAARIAVRLRVRARGLALVVADDGAGFDPVATLARGEGLGLLGMRERASLLGGRLAIRSTPGRGSVVRLTVRPGRGRGGT